MDKKELISQLDQISNEILEIEMKFFKKYGRANAGTQKVGETRNKLDDLIKKIKKGKIE